MTDNMKVLLWFSVARQATQHMQNGDFASAAKVIRKAMTLGVYADASAWRTALICTDERYWL